jgi:hypothetical protein
MGVRMRENGRCKKEGKEKESGGFYIRLCSSVVTSPMNINRLRRVCLARLCSSIWSHH